MAIQLEWVQREDERVWMSSACEGEILFAVACCDCGEDHWCSYVMDVRCPFVMSSPADNFEDAKAVCEEYVNEQTN